MSVNSFREDEEQKQSIKLDVITRLLKYLLEYKKIIAVVLLIMGVTTAISLINPLLIERVLNVEVADAIAASGASSGDVAAVTPSDVAAVSPSSVSNVSSGDAAVVSATDAAAVRANSVKGILIIGAIALGLNLIYIIGVRLRMKLMAIMSNGVLMRIREQLYRHIQTLGFKFFDSRPTGKILSRVIGDVNSLKDVLSSGVTTLIPEFVTLVSVIVIMLVKNWQLGLAALITLPFLMIGMWVIQLVSHKRWMTYRKKSSNLNAFTHEDFSGIRVVQSFSAEDETTEDFKFLNGEYTVAFEKAVRWADAFGPIIDVMWVIGSILLYWTAVRILGIREDGIGTIVAFSTYMGMFWTPIRNLGNFYNTLISNLSAAERIFDILDTEPEIFDREGVEELAEISGRVEFKNVSFSYEDDQGTKVLNDVSFVAKPGETIALVGPTGAGKTTIVNLISRFYDVQKGDILIDKHSIRDVSVHSLRQQMGVMTQDNFIFSGTVRDNIRYGRLSATDEEIEAAAKATGAHEFISKLEKGYDTELSEHGTSLSVGQRQLIAFARTMVSMPRILILDEATSSIDTHTELLVQAGIAAILKGRTSFVIAHRLSTIKNADRIFVINHGRIIEQGSHQELMEKQGEYYELYNAQFKSLKRVG